ncbi:unnamed protein product [Absidia cylindrospora]
MTSNYYINNNNNSSGAIATMNSNNNNNNNNLNNDLFLTPDPFANYLFGAPSPSVSPNPPTSSVDEWLADELHQNGLLPLMPDFLKQEHTMMDYYLAQPSPALTTCSPTSSGSSVSSAHDDSPYSSSAKTPPATANVAPPLFPDITPTTATKKPGFRAIAPAKKQPVPIMPKSAAAAAANTNASISSNPGATALLPNGMASGHHHPLAHPLHLNGGSSTKRKYVDEKENDDIAMKRQKNTDAARRSRLKKLVKMEALEARVVELETDNTRLSTRIAVLESEKSGLESKDKGLEERIRTLEAQLAEAHKALTSRH